MYISEQPAGIGKDGIKTKRAANDTQKRNKKIRKLLSLKKVKKMETNEVENGVSSTLKVSSITSVRAQIRISEFEEKNASKFNCQNRWIGDNFIQWRFPTFCSVTSIENPLVSISELWWRSRHKLFHQKEFVDRPALNPSSTILARYKAWTLHWAEVIMRLNDNSLLVIVKTVKTSILHNMQNFRELNNPEWRWR